MPDSETNRIFRDNFKEIVPPFKAEDALAEAQRCLYCYDAPCIQACPTHIDVPRFIKQIASRNVDGSGRTILEANAMGHSCARVCPVEVLCEGACVYHDWQDKPISIARLQRFATDHVHATGPAPILAGPDNGRRVAVIGAGPAGLSCGTYLRRLGYAVTVYERDRLPGGLNTFGVAEYKMSMRTSLQEVRMLLDLGAKLVSGKEIGKDIKASDLLEGFDAVFVGVGLGSTRRLGIPGEDLRGVWEALSFIRWVKARRLAPLGRSETTIVIGAGNTSIDAATQSKRIGARRVVMAYRRGPAAMGAYGFELDLAKSDGTEFLWNAQPARILGKKKVEGMQFLKTRTKGGKLTPIPGSKFIVNCDRVIKAIGQTKLTAIAEGLGLRLRHDGRIAVDAQSLASSNPKVFAGGDAINGGKEVVNAAADGKRAAWNIHQRLSGDTRPPKGHEYWISTIDGRQVAPIPERHGK